MRIRKRQVPLPFSSLSPLPLSDPLLRRTPPVQLPSSDPPNLHPYATFQTNALENQPQEKDDDDSSGFRAERSVFGAERSSNNNGVLPQSTSSPDQVEGGWCEREKVFPLKKRRGGFERSSDDDQNNNNKDDENRTTSTSTSMVKSQDQRKMSKTKTNKKDALSQKQSKLGVDLSGKKRSRGGVLMEGSRCSRVNGRGWRCCQQTLVGYSLCEHHLGKGRLRSMNSVRNRSLASTIATSNNAVIVDEDEKKPSPFPQPPSSSLTLTNKKRMKLGVVKARSISSLLGQPDDVMAATPLPPPPPPSHDDNIDD